MSDHLSRGIVLRGPQWGCLSKLYQLIQYTCASRSMPHTVWLIPFEAVDQSPIRSAVSLAFFSSSSATSNILILSAALPLVIAAFAYKLGFTIFSDFEFLNFGKNLWSSSSKLFLVMSSNDGFLDKKNMTNPKSRIWIRRTGKKSH